MMKINIEIELNLCKYNEIGTPYFIKAIENLEKAKNIIWQTAEPTIPTKEKEKIMKQLKMIK